MLRKQAQFVVKDLDQKMVFLSGPRQVGKTTLAKSLIKKWPKLYYLNFDKTSDKKIFLKQEWDRKADIVVFDEIHKWRKWKIILKGIYDTEGISPKIFVTGSARLDLYRKGGDSLAGRYFLHRLYPFSVSELKNVTSPHDSLKRLMSRGGFPEPYFSKTDAGAKRWRNQYLSRVLQEDIRSVSSVSDVEAMTVLIEMLRERVGSTISYSSLAEDLQVSSHTVKKWIQILESIYLIFKITPYHRNIARAILKEPKIYFYDVGMVRGDQGAVFENLVAVSLLKHLHYLEDTQGISVKLLYLRDKEKREVDFLTQEDNQVTHLVEAKLSDENASRALLHWEKQFPKAQKTQLVYNATKTRTVSTIQIEPAAPWLSRLAL